MRAQVSVEFLVNLLIWFVFISVLSIGILSLNEVNRVNTNNYNTEKELVETVILAEQMQSSGFTVLTRTPEFKFKNGWISFEISGKEIVKNSIYKSEEIYGKPV